MNADDKSERNLFRVEINVDWGFIFNTNQDVNSVHCEPIKLKFLKR